MSPFCCFRFPLKPEDVASVSNPLPKKPCQCGSRFVRRSMMLHVEMTLQRINRRNVGKTNQLGKEAGSATVSATGSQRLPDKKPRQGIIIPARGSYLLRKSLHSAFPYVPNTARNGRLLLTHYLRHQLVGYFCIWICKLDFL